MKGRSCFGFPTLLLAFCSPPSPVKRLLVLTVPCNAFLVLFVDPCGLFDALDGMPSSAEPSSDKEGSSLIAGFLEVGLEFFPVPGGRKEETIEVVDNFLLEARVAVWRVKVSVEGLQEYSE